MVYAITIQKAQGLTLSVVVIDIGLKEVASGLTFVVISRVRKLIDITFVTFYDTKGLTASENRRPTKQK